MKEESIHRLKIDNQHDHSEGSRMCPGRHIDELRFLPTLRPLYDRQRRVLGQGERRVRRGGGGGGERVEKDCSPVDEERRPETGTRKIQDLFERLAASLFRG